MIRMHTNMSQSWTRLPRNAVLKSHYNQAMRKVNHIHPGENLLQHKFILVQRITIDKLSSKTKEIVTTKPT